MGLQGSGTDKMTSTPVSQTMSFLDVQPPPIARSPRFMHNMWQDNVVVPRRWADYADDEPLPTVVFGVTMKPIDVNLLSRFNSVSDDKSIFWGEKKNNTRFSESSLTSWHRAPEEKEAGGVSWTTVSRNNTHRKKR